MKSRIATFLIATSALLVGLSGCATTHSHEGEAAPEVTDVWVRAIPDTAVDGDMTGMFTTINNPTNEDVYPLGGTTDGTFTPDPLDAHEVVQDSNGDMVMQDAEGGILIPANGSVQLMPGGYHIMFWNLTSPIPVGETVTATLNFSNGTSVDVEAISMTVEMGQEKYVGEASMDMSN